MKNYFEILHLETYQKLQCGYCGCVCVYVWGGEEPGRGKKKKKINKQAHNSDPGFLADLFKRGAVPRPFF